MNEWMNELLECLFSTIFILGFIFDEKGAKLCTMNEIFNGQEDVKNHVNLECLSERWYSRPIFLDCIVTSLKKELLGATCCRSAMSHVTAVPCQDGCEEVTKAIDIILLWAGDAHSIKNMASSIAYSVCSTYCCRFIE